MPKGLLKTIKSKDKPKSNQEIKNPFMPNSPKFGILRGTIGPTSIS